MSTTVRRIPRQRNVARPGRIYLILTKPVDQLGMPIPGAPPEVGYIGQTRQQVRQRGDQHRASQPFADLIVGEVLTLDQGVWTDAQLDAREEMWIRLGVSVGGLPAQRPRYNHDCNLNNPDRIEIWRAVQQRQVREPGWLPAPREGGVRVPRQRGRQPVVGVSPVSRWWQRRRGAVALWAAVWLLLFAGSWWAGADSWQGWDEPRNAAVLASLATAGIGWRRWNMTRRRSRRQRRRRRSRR